MQDAKGPGRQKAEKSKTAHKKERSRNLEEKQNGVNVFFLRILGDSRVSKNLPRPPTILSLRSPALHHIKHVKICPPPTLNIHYFYLRYNYILS